VQLIGGKNSEGYFHALEQVYEGESIANPSPSALSQMRKRVSFRFFRDAFENSVEQAEEFARTFRGKRIYAMDGFELNLPRTADVLKNGFQGRWVSEYRQQYYPTLYTVFCLDVLSETIRDVRISERAGEQALAQPMIAALEPGSLSLYDRGFPSREKIRAHKEAQNHFLFRLRSNSFKEAQRLLGLKIKRRKTVIEGVVVYFFKFKNPKTGEMDLFATDLPRYWVDEHTIRSLYNLRWECETSFSDFVKTLCIEQWHSKFVNGILQEFYASLWLYNFTKMQILDSGQIDKNPLNWEYEKPNFKFILDWVIRKFSRIFKRLLDPAKPIQKLIIKSTAHRKRHSRSKPRVLKYSLKRYPFESTVWVIGN
jgi:hypothetical protein